MRSLLSSSDGRRGGGRRLLPFLLLLLLPIPGAASTGEYRVKAVFLFNFAQFVEWPPAAFSDAATPIIIGVLGDDPFGAALDEVVQGESINGRALAIRRFHRLEEIGLCHILYISDSEARRLGLVIARLTGRAILTVSDAEEAARRGVMISLFTESNRIRLRINVEAARSAGLVISSKLLRPAVIVTGKEETR